MNYLRKNCREIAFLLLLLLGTLVFILFFEKNGINPILLRQPDITISPTDAGKSR